MKSAQRILVLDDEAQTVDLIASALDERGYEASAYTSPARAIDALREERFAILLTDYEMPDLNGIEVLRKAKKIDEEIEVIMVTAHGTVQGAVEAMREGASDYLLKPFDLIELTPKIDRALERRALKLRVRSLENEVRETTEHHIFAESKIMKNVLRLVRQVGPSDANVLVLGESGTGKELIARMLHFESRRSSGNLVVMDCGATPTSLIEAELFGYQKGSYTGATKDKPGIIEEADGGTLFLDEIGNITPELQTRLLRVLESGEFRRVGELKQRRVDIRVIAATNADLDVMVQDGVFREDLLYRLRVITVALPSLRERTDDIPGLVQIFIREFSDKTGKEVSGINREAMAMLMRHRWPGNIRELKNVMEAAVVLSRGPVITQDEIILSGVRNLPPQSHLEEDLNVLESQERVMVLDALKKSGWVQKDAASMLGISQRVMHYKIKKYNIKRGDTVV